jgi:hypothetical protein
VAFALALEAVVVLVIVSLPRLGNNVLARRIALGAAAVGLGAALLAPAAYAASTTGTAYGGGDPHPGPGAVGSVFGGAGFGGAGSASAGANGPSTGKPPAGFGGGFPTGGGPGGLGGVSNGTDSTALDDYLVANRGSAKWIVAADGSMQAGSIELATGLPVMAMGGFTGSDPTPTLDQLKSYIASGQLRFVLAGSSGLGGGAAGGPGGGTSEATTWVTATCKAVTIGGATSSLYDCAGAA